METFPSKNIAITWVEKGSLARNLFLSLGFAIVTALSAQIRIELPITPVPITAQTFVVILAGLLLGSTFGSLSMLMYLFTGLAGLPFFSGSVAGLAILKSPTIGYIIGFFLDYWKVITHTLGWNTFRNRHDLFMWGFWAYYYFKYFSNRSLYYRCCTLSNW